MCRHCVTMTFSKGLNHQIDCALFLLFKNLFPCRIDDILQSPILICLFHFMKSPRPFPSVQSDSEYGPNCRPRKSRRTDTFPKRHYILSDLLCLNPAKSGITHFTDKRILTVHDWYMEVAAN